MFCPKCGNSLADDAKFCAGCGTQTGNQGTAGGTSFEDTVKNFNNTSDTTNQYDPADIEKNKILSLFSYIGILFLIPLLATNNSRFARFHVNQGLVLFIVEVIWGFAINILSLVLAFIGLGFISAIIGVVSAIVSLVLFAFVILGIVNAVNGKAKELPIIGKFKLLN